MNYGSLYRFEEARYDNLEDLSQVTDLLKLNAGDKVWIDQGTGGKWQVYEKVKNYSASVSDTVNTPPGQKFGSSIFASDDSPVMLVSAPDWRIDGTYSWGRVKVFNKVNGAWVRTYDYILNTEPGNKYCSSTSSTQFGYSLQYDIGKKLYITGAPEASDVMSTGTSYLLPFLNLNKGNINEGLVKIDSRLEDFPAFTETVISHRLSTHYSRFGHSVSINQVSNTASTTLLVGAPGPSFLTTSSLTATNFGAVYSYNITPEFVVTPRWGVPLYTTSSVTLTDGAEWGYKIASCSIGFAVSAPGQTNDTGIVQLFNNNLEYFQTIASPFGEGGRFGHDIAITTSGNYLLISAPEVKNTNEPYGKVVIYPKKTSTLTITTSTGDQLTTDGDVEELYYVLGTFVTGEGIPAGTRAVDILSNFDGTIVIISLSAATTGPVTSISFTHYSSSTVGYQVIDNPLPTNDLKFGYSISISKDEQTIGIGALGKTRSSEQIFDENNNSGKTTFDNDSTKFSESLPDAGTVYLYNKIGNKFIQADELNDVKIIEEANTVAILPLNVSVNEPSAPVISNITLSETVTNIGNTIIVNFHTDVNINYIIGQVDDLTYGPYGGTIQNSPSRDHYFYIDTSRLPAGIRNLTIYAKNASTEVWGTAYTTFTLEPAIYTITAGSRYGSAVVVTNNEVFVGAPTNQSNLLPAPATDASRLFMFSKIDSSSQGWKVLRQQEDSVDLSTIGRVALIDTVKEEIVEYLDVIDPVKGKIAGIAEQELKYKAAFDPATYSIGLAGIIVNTDTNWLDEHVGELWWDLSTAKYTWYEQGDEVYRKNNWGRLFPGASIDVYEWVKSDLLPSEWAALADTTKGLVNSISGQPKYPDNSVISVKQLFNNVTGSFENVYYYWVKNKVTLPNVKNRRLSSFQVASYIADPVANGLKFVEILSSNAVAFANVQPMLIGNRINANITIDYNLSLNNVC